jgi:osmoprotectant transport system permease protein
MNQEKSGDAQTVLEQMTQWLREEHNIHCLGSLGFENAYRLAMRKNQAAQLNIQDMNDLDGHEGKMKIGGDYEFFGRPEWHSIKQTYKLDFADQISYDSTFMYEALAKREVDVISAFSSDGRIEAYNLTLLDDPQNVIPPYDAVLLLSDDAYQRKELVRTLQPLIGAIQLETMRRANYMVDRDENKSTVHQAARWLREQIFNEYRKDQ